VRALLQAANVSFEYAQAARRARPVDAGDGVSEHPPALGDISLTVERGEIVGLLGANGSGKTTLIRVLAGLLTPRTGQVLLDGRPLASLGRREIARRIAVVPQETHAVFDYSVLEMVLMGRFPHLGPLTLEGPDDLTIARDALSATGALAFETRPFGTLSSGEKQRVVIASALAQSADALFLDEPTAALDLGHQIGVATLLRDLNRTRRTTVLISTHDLSFAAAVCDRAILLAGGRILASGAMHDVVTPESIRAVYGVEADVQFHPKAGHLTVVPLVRSH
jgi:iron complex transport system ATP-binding protein